jgi:hypothetical protein
MSQRFRSAWLSENMPMLVLRLLRDTSLTEWEILSRLHSRYGLTPSSREFGRLEKSLLGKGFVSLESETSRDKLRITNEGVGLLVRLEKEYADIVSNIAHAKGLKT